MRRLDLRSKLVLGLAVVLVPMLAVVAWGFAVDRQVRRELLFASMSQTAEVAALLVDRAIGEVMNVARTVTVDEDLSFNPVHLKRMVDQLVRYHGDLSNVGVFDLEGDVVAIARDLPGGRSNIADRAYFQEVLSDGRPVLSSVLIGRFVQAPSIIAAAPIPDDVQRTVAVSVATLSVDKLEQLLSGIRLRKGQAIFLVDPSGRLAFHTGVRDLPWGARDLSEHPLIRRALAGEVIAEYASLTPVVDGQHVMALRPTGNAGWVVGVAWPREAAYRPLWLAQRERMILLALMALAAIVGALVVSTYLTRPVQRLAAAAQAFGAGEENARVDIRTRDELEDLASAFNAMAARIADERTKRENVVSAVAHDLGNVLTPLQTSVALLQKQLGSETPAALRHLERVHNQTHRINRLVTDLLDLSRIDTGRLRVELVEHDFAEVVRRVVDEQRQVTGRVIELTAPGALVLKGDPDRLAQIVTNLVTNAAKYSAEAAPIHARLSATTDAALFEVKDEGVGFTIEQQAQLFQPYARFHTEGTRGLGMGLYISQALAHAHGGTLTAESPGTGRGAVFRLLIPLAR